MRLRQIFAALVVSAWSAVASAQGAPAADTAGPGDDSAKTARAISAPVARLLATAEDQIKSGRQGAAQATLQRAVTRASAEGDARGRSEAARRLGVLISSSARLRIDASRVPLDGFLLVSVDGELVRPEDWAHALFVEAGSRTVNVRRPGCFEYRSEVEAEHGKTVVVTVPTLSCTDEFATGRKTRRRRSVPVLFVPDDVENMSGRRLDDRSKYLMGSIVGGAITVGLGTTTIIFALSAADNKAEAEAVGCTGSTCASYGGRARYRSYESNKGLAITFGVLTGIATTASVVSGALAYRATASRKKSRRVEHSSVGLVPVQGGAVLGWSGAF